MIRVYLDTSTYNRPLDDQTQPKISLETKAVTIILRMIEVQILESVTSDVLKYENSLNPYLIKKEAMSRHLQLAQLRQPLNESILQRGKELEQNGVKAIDALQVASAEASQSDYFITCDKRLINRCVGLTLKVVNPIDFILEVSSDDPN